MTISTLQGCTSATHRIAIAVMGLLGALLGSVAHGQQQDCIELKTTAETVEEYVNDQGDKATRLVAVGKVVPGAEIVWTITARNVCNAPADDIVIANRVPAETTYVADSAMGVGTQITYSLGNEDFEPANALIVSEADGSSHPARAEDIRAIRWTYRAPFAPGASAFVRYRTIVK